MKIKTIAPNRPKNSYLRNREHLTSHEIDRIILASKKLGRHRARDSTMILMTFRHGLRVCELLALRWDHIDLNQGHLFVSRRKNGIHATHPLFGPEIRALRLIKRTYPESSYIFTTERKGPLTESTFRKIVKRAGIEAGIGFPIHPHMLRHATGYKLANDGHDTRIIQHYLGHKNIQHTVRYTEVNPSRFKNLWKD